MLTIVLAFLLAVSAISAADNDTSDVIGVEETTVDVVKETSNDVVSVENDENGNIDFQMKSDMIKLLKFNHIPQIIT